MNTVSSVVQLRELSVKSELKLNSWVAMVGGNARKSGGLELLNRTFKRMCWAGGAPVVECHPQCQVKTTNMVDYGRLWV